MKNLQKNSNIIWQPAISRQPHPILSSNINEVIRSVLNFLFFFHDKILHAQKEYKAPKSTKKH